MCVLGALTAPVSRWLPGDSLPTLRWWVELAAHWQWLYAAVGTVALATLLALRPARWQVVPALVLAGCFMGQAATLSRGPDGPAQAAVLTVGTANLNLDTTDFAPLVRWLASAEAPDVVVLQEYTALAHAALDQSAAVAARYPYRLAVPQPDPFGLAIVSRHPLADTQALQPATEHDTLRLRATVDWNGRPVHLSALHPMPPLSSAFARARDRALQDEVRHLAQWDGLALMAGDLNTTPWARGLWQAGQADMRRAGPAVPTWPNAWGWLSVLPLDHVLAGPGWRRMDADTGPDLGSDHRPVVARLVPR